MEPDQQPLTSDGFEKAFKEALQNPIPIPRVKSWHHDLQKIYRFGLDEQRRVFRYKCLGCFAEYVIDFTPHRFCPCCGIDYAEFV